MTNCALSHWKQKKHNSIFTGVGWRMHNQTSDSQILQSNALPPSGRATDNFQWDRPFTAGFLYENTA